jgi:hypothetical protein
LRGIFPDNPQDTSLRIPTPTYFDSTQPFHFDPQEPPKAGKQEIKGTKSKKVRERQAIREREEVGKRNPDKGAKRNPKLTKLTPSLPSKHYLYTSYLFHPTTTLYLTILERMSVP